MNTILFDLDGTLLPMDQDKFVKVYFGALCQTMAPFGFEPKKLVDSIWACTKKVICSDNGKTNETVFWESFKDIYGSGAMKYQPVFDKFYENEFGAARSEALPNPLADKCVKLLKAKGYRIILATNPIFPRVATYSRVEWAGLDAEDFELITTYENSCYCKPNPQYFLEILEKTGVRAEDCLMVGNDVAEDMCAAKVGIKTLLLTDCLINTKGADISEYDCFDFDRLYEYFSALPEIK